MLGYVTQFVMRPHGVSKCAFRLASSGSSFFQPYLAITKKAKMCVCVYGFYGAYNYSGLVRQVSGFSNVVSVRRVHVVLSTAGFKGGGKPCHKTRETAALWRGIQKASRT